MVYEENNSTQNLTNLHQGFKELVSAWKKTEAIFIASDFNDSISDLPLLIDHFRIKNEDIGELLDRALAKSDDLKTLLYKNSTRGITALEHLLYAPSLTNRHIEASKIVIDNITEKAVTIKNFYENDKKFISDSQDASDALVNILIDSAYKLKEWRIGDAAGLTIKSKGVVAKNKLEYHKSTLSLDAIKSILQAHKQIMHIQPYENFATFATANGANKEVQEIQNSLDKVIAVANSFEGLLEDEITEVASDKTIDLYNKTIKLYSDYYNSLISALNITSKIIEADGD